MRRSRLVCQHLEGVSRDALERHQKIIREYVRGRPGVYALYRRGKLYYVGLATSLRSRLRHHLRDRHSGSWDRFSVYLTIGNDHLRELEALIVRIVKPKGNKQKGKFGKRADLRRQFRRDIKRNLMAEVDGLFAEYRPRRRLPAVEVAEGRTPVLAAHITAPMKLRARHKGKRHVARVRSDGTVAFGGEFYTSPSLAAAAACNRKTCNGWKFWQYERAPGDWVLLDTLRE